MMKRISVLAGVAIVMACFPIVAAESNATPEDCIRNFYRWYVTTVEANGDPLKQHAKMKQFATDRLLKEIDRKSKSPDGAGSDYFVNAQDFDPLWASKIKISGVRIQGEKASAHVLLDGAGEMKRKLQVQLAKESGSWKVDQVKGLD